VHRPGGRGVLGRAAPSHAVGFSSRPHAMEQPHPTPRSSAGASPWSPAKSAPNPTHRLLLLLLGLLAAARARAAAAGSVLQGVTVHPGDEDIPLQLEAIPQLLAGLVLSGPCDLVEQRLHQRWRDRGRRIDEALVKQQCRARGVPGLRGAGQGRAGGEGRGLSSKTGGRLSSRFGVAAAQRGAKRRVRLPRFSVP
jgi:hypothetical protein